MHKVKLYLSKINLENITIILKVYLLAILLFTGFRALLFFTSLDKLGNNYLLTDLLGAFLMGWRFDIVICSYLLLIPYFLLTISLFVKPIRKIIQPIVFYLIFILFTLSFLVCAADIPYFHQFFSRFSVSAFVWKDSPFFVLKMVFEEPSYWLYVVPFLLTVFLFYRGLRKIFKDRGSKKEKKQRYISKIIFSVIFLGLIFLGMRGRTAIKSPIRVGTAFFCDNSLLNKIGLNPNFTLIKSYLEKQKTENKPINLMNSQTALQNVRNYLNVVSQDTLNPLLRVENVNSDSINKPNIVIIIMESMSVGKMERGGNTHQLTPFLDSLSHQGYYFKNTYSAGIHTFNGIFSTLFSFPAIFGRHSMKHIPIREYSSISYSLKKLGYTRTFFIPHDGQFDNVKGFLMANDFEHVYCRKDYPSDKIESALGVPDDFMFRFSIPVLNKLHQKGKPFFVAYMTASDHGPWYVPDYFHPHSKKKEHQSTEYADYSLRTFMNLAREQKWFGNTLFVFIADHGSAIDATYDISLDYNHVPLLFYSPNLIPQPKEFEKMAGQIDVYPSIMGLLELPFKNNTLGINLFQQERPYIYFGIDNKYAVINQKWLFIQRKNGKPGLYKYRNQDKKNYITKNIERRQEMDAYAKSNIQTYQYLLNNGLTKLK